MLFALVSAAGVYFYKEHQQTNVNRQLVEQLGVGAQQTAAIAAYLNDDVLATEIINGLALNDLVAGVTIENQDGLLASVGSNGNKRAISILLEDPFTKGEVVGTFRIYPDYDFIQKSVTRNAIENASVLLLISLFTSLIVGWVVQQQLTTPISKLTNAFENQKGRSPDTFKPIEIGYNKKDEFGLLIDGINSLTLALKDQFTREQQLRLHHGKLQEHFKLIFEQARAGIGIINSDNQLITKNPAFNHLCPKLIESTDFVGAFVQREQLKTHFQRLRLVNSSDQIAVDISFIDGSQERVLHCLFARICDADSNFEAGEEVLIEVIAYDITERTYREKRTKFEADHDVLTGLLNRRAGKREIKKMNNKELNGTVLMMVDLDKFKPVNDLYGHDAGDIVLRQVGQVIKRTFNDMPSVACRWGGDEFLIAIPEDERTESTIKEMCDKLIMNISQPITVEEGVDVQISASIGVSRSSHSNEELEELIAAADATMYEVKKSRKGELTHKMT
ncbi:sensor domain-containing diguanylate cyclase [Agaribacter flavus]|uniref:Diguanylate cyclase domain-containing protein n=1 Tax=Agaribacter flavus TaxID=1902781 RepID=A0ABV7FUS9_9ALTE